MNRLENIIVKELLGKEASCQFQNGNISNKFLERYSKIIKCISENYVNNKNGNLFKNMNKKDFALAYSLYYLPINFYKVSHIFSCLDLKSFKNHKIKFLDYGSGPATGALSATNFFSDIDFVLFDESLQMLEIGKKLLTAYSSSLNINITQDFKSLFRNSYDVITVLNSVNEFSEEDFLRLFDNVNKLLADNGILIFMEPALKSCAQNLMMIRNKILEKYKFSILYPCTHQGECRMLNCENDWCHTCLGGLDSKLVKQLDTLTGYNKHRIKYSSMVFQKSKIENNEKFFRVVNIPKITNHGISLALCGENFFDEVIFSKKEIKENKALKKIKFFDRIESPF